MKIEKWTRSDNYMGETYCEYYVIYSRHRDSDLVDISNFEVILEILGEDAITPISNHWAVGWVQTILVHESKHRARIKANQLIKQLEEYPLLNEDDYSARQVAKTKQIHEDCIANRIDPCYCEDCQYFVED